MTKKHFVMLAATLKEIKPAQAAKLSFWHLTCFSIADFCQSQNAQFDRERFLQACRVTK